MPLPLDLLPLTSAQRVEHFRKMIAGDQRWALRALVVVYGFQTDAEQQDGRTSELNGVGFSGRDSDILSSFAQAVIRWNAETTHKYASPLSPKQMVWVHRLMPEYAAQLVRHLESAEAPALVHAAPEAPQRTHTIPTAAQDAETDILPAVVLTSADAIRKPAPAIVVPQIAPLTSSDLRAARERVEARNRAPVDLVALARTLGK